MSINVLRNYRLRRLLYGATLTNPDFRVWTSGDPTGWTVSAETGTEFIEEHADGARIVTAGNLIYMEQELPLVEDFTYAFQLIIDVTDGEVDVARGDGSSFTTATGATNIGTSGVHEGNFKAQLTGAKMAVSIKRTFGAGAVDIVVKHFNIWPIGEV